MSVVIATAYMDEAQQWDWIVADGRRQGAGDRTPAELMQKTGTKGPREVLHRLLPRRSVRGHTELTIPPARRQAGDRDRRQGADTAFRGFTAVDSVTLSIERGRDLRIPRARTAAASPTTMKMLTGLLPAHGRDGRRCSASSVEAGSMEVRKNLGYMTQAFSLYGEMTIRQNLVLHARLYHLPPDKAKARIDELVGRFGLEDHLDALADDLPMDCASDCRWRSPSCTNRRS
jgi:ribosome-dependent ATPase